MPTLREEFQLRSRQISSYLDTEERFEHAKSFDYTVPDQLTVTCYESRGGRPLVFVLSATKFDATYVDRELAKAVTEYDRTA